MTDIEAEWKRCSPWLEAALEHGFGTHTIDDVWNAVQGGTMQFWPGKDAAIVTEVTNYPRRKICTVFMAGGSLNELLIMQNSIAVWAKFHGCDLLQCCGRKGWDRVFKDARFHSVMVAKEL